MKPTCYNRPPFKDYVPAPIGWTDADEMETEITIIDCPAGGVLDDDGKATHYEHVAYLTEYPEEGTFPLGAELAHNA